VNLCLRLGPLRPDGYHRVTTLLQAIDLYDELEREPAGETEVEGFAEDTLVTGALAALGEPHHVRIEKHIPVAAGLGGGSSDAAAVLRALRGERTANELHEIARALGTDVPFFLSGAETGFCTGRGDRVQALPDFPRGHAFVVVPAAEGVSTADVYAGFTGPPDGTPPTVTLLTPNGGEVWGTGSTHDLTWSAGDDVSGVTLRLEY
jgi:4-diphosphocytidyl-2-C-methyl-D-erythritol kinase